MDWFIKVDQAYLNHLLHFYSFSFILIILSFLPTSLCLFHLQNVSNGHVETIVTRLHFIFFTYKSFLFISTFVLLLAFWIKDNFISILTIFAFLLTFGIILIFFGYHFMIKIVFVEKMTMIINIRYDMLKS